ncbi:rod shape-determining protein MreD [Litchfieldia salsa]|uniref:Rod shape-determining protein MreD n=1 Tax=Litchfieldia salsa TaxID=930152 RepID=A0A1H0NT82_9BACI|nr:rod shape-determining protein MreD [Litchfieldia salsa]SDO95864.1 rod shape-determining protein MreD [Litchfieldia salsa]
MMKRLILPIILLFLFILESIFVDVLPASFIMEDHLLVPHFLFVTIVFISIRGNRNEGMLLGAIYGLMFDIVYTGILGLYLFSFPLIAYVISKLAGILQNHIVIISILSIVSVVILEFFVFGVNSLIGYTTITMNTFIERRLISTAILNGIFVILLSYPLAKLIDKLSVVE